MDWIKRNLFPLLASGFIATYVWFAASHVIAHAQKPEPSISFSSTSNSTGAFKPNAHEIYLQMDGKLIAIFSDKGRLAVVEPAFWKMVESHCVAVLTEADAEKYSVIENNDQVPEVGNEGHYVKHTREQALKLRCTAEPEKK